MATAAVRERHSILSLQGAQNSLNCSGGIITILVSNPVFFSCLARPVNDGSGINKHDWPMKPLSNIVTPGCRAKLLVGSITNHDEFWAFQSPARMYLATTREHLA